MKTTTLVVAVMLVLGGLRVDAQRGNANPCPPDSDGSYGTWSYLMFRGGPTHTLEIKQDGSDVVLINRYSDGSQSRKILTRCQACGDCAWSDRASEHFDEWFEITASGLKLNDRGGFVRTASKVQQR